MFLTVLWVCHLIRKCQAPKIQRPKMIARDVIMLCIDDLKDSLPEGDGVNRVCAVLLTSMDNEVFQVKYHLLDGNRKKATLTTDFYRSNPEIEKMTLDKVATVAILKHIRDLRGI